MYMLHVCMQTRESRAVIRRTTHRYGCTYYDLYYLYYLPVFHAV